MSIFRLSLYLCVFSFPLLAFGAQVPSKSFGANIHLMQRSAEEDWAATLDSAHNIGVRIGREEFSWNEIEFEDDEFNWSKSDAVVAAYEAADMKIVGLLSYTSDWATATEGGAHAVPELNAWSDYVSQVAARYAGRVSAWEIWNEPNHSSFFAGDSADYVYVLQTASNAIRDADPDAKVVLGGLSGADTSFLREVLPNLNPNAIDAIGIHPYRVIGNTFTYAPEEMQDGLNTLAVDLGNLVAELERDGFADTPLWLTEFGYPTHDLGLTQKQQAQYLARAYLIAISNPHVKKIFWYSLLNAGGDESDQEDRFGLFSQDLTRKTAARAHIYLLQNIASTKIKGIDLTQSQDLGGVADIGWSVAGAVCTEATLSTDAGALNIDYAFTADTNCYVPVSTELALPYQTQTLFLRISGSSDDTTLRVRLRDDSGETFQYTLSRMPQESTWYRVNINSLSTHWGGDDDGVPNDNLILDSIVLDDADSVHEEGRVTIREIRASTLNDVYGYRFSMRGKPIVALWTTATAHTSPYTFAQGRTIRRYRFRKSTIQMDGLSFSFRVGPMPQFLEVQ